MKTLKVKISSAKKSSEYSEVVSITVPSTKGEIEILPEHMPLITELEQGTITIETQGGKKTTMLSSGGYARVQNDEVGLLLDEVDLAEELVEEEIKQAIANAEKMIANPELPPSELIQLEKRLRYERFKLNKLD